MKFMDTSGLPHDLAKIAEAAYKRAVNEGRVVIDEDGGLRAFATPQRAALRVELKGGTVLQGDK